MFDIRVRLWHYNGIESKKGSSNDSKQSKFRW